MIRCGVLLSRIREDAIRSCAIISNSSSGQRDENNRKALRGRETGKFKLKRLRKSGRPVEIFPKGKKRVNVS